ncbi:hypothetical protein ACGFWF_33735 [Streptomyces sp. NPDC048581]|uniref:hypothetical protein n=1 Tax=Streptomyces sp. NPDC048581 TaxID=3365572 RepID=UPI003716D49E
MTRNSTLVGTVLGAATVAMGLIAGAFYIFACGVMPGLARSDDRVYVEVMRDMNDAFENPVFFLSFLGALVLTGVSAGRRAGSRTGGGCGRQRRRTRSPSSSPSPSTSR